jgi:hypothetical protein
MLKPSFALTLGLFALSQGGCGGMSANAVTFDGAYSSGYITGDVDGTTVRAELMPAAGISGVADGLIWLNAGTTSVGLGWTLYIENSVGTTTDGSNWVALFQTGSTLRSDNPGGTSTVAVTTAAPALGDILEGTFSATVTTMATTSETAVVTNGAFHVQRNHD